MNRVKLTLAALGASVLLAMPSPAPAQGGGSVSVLFAFPNGAKLISETSIPIEVTGQLTVSFHGSVAAGCAAAGLCPYSGTIVVSPRSGQLGIEKYRLHGRIGELALLNFNPGEDGYTTVAEVRRSVPGQPSGLCADAQMPSLETLSAVIRRGGSLRIALLQPGGTLLSTRCAGPLDGDLTSVSPQAMIPLGAALRGASTIDLSADSPFASHGFAGTLDSTLVLELGRPESNSTQPVFPPGIKTQRVRTVVEHLDLVRVDGGVSAAIQGTADPIVCGLLDSCGLTGTLDVGLGSHGSAGTLIATGPASRPYVDFLAALGLSRTGNRRGISVGGGIRVSPTGTVTETLTQSGVTCADSASAGPLGVALDMRGDALTGGASLLGTWRTRCPGPMVGVQTPLLSAEPVSLAALGRTTFTVRLRAGGPLAERVLDLAARPAIADGSARAAYPDRFHAADRLAIPRPAGTPTLGVAMKTAIITVSTSVAAGRAQDRSGEALAKLAEAAGAEIVARDVVPDDRKAIEKLLRRHARNGAALIFTTGGTGFTHDDVTPEATRAVIERDAPGFAEAMRAEALKHTPMGILSRGVSGIAGRTLIVNFPGNPKAIGELFPVIGPTLGHVVTTLQHQGGPTPGH